MEPKYFWLKDEEWHEMYEIGQGRKWMAENQTPLWVQELTYHFVFASIKWYVSKGAKEIKDDRDIACNISSD